MPHLVAPASTPIRQWVHVQFDLQQKQLMTMAGLWVALQALLWRLAEVLDQLAALKGP